jgi:hypothetical protein
MTRREAANPPRHAWQGCLGAHVSLLATDKQYLATFYHPWALLRDDAAFARIVRALQDVDRCARDMDARTRCWPVI